MSIDLPADKDLEYDWEECYAWIKRCGLLNSNDSIYQNQDPGLFLMHECMDGVLPLQILNVLSNKTIDPTKYREYTPNPKESQFDCVTNLKLFNSLLLKNFSIDESDIVEAANIYSGKEFGKFILLLSKLSKSKLAEKLNIEGFPRQNHPIIAVHEYYNRLEDLAVRKDFHKRQRNVEEYFDRNPDEEKVYETLVQHKTTRDLVVPANKSAREMCILEIVESEKNYVESLQILIVGYMNPMTKHLSKDEIDIIFKHIEDFYKIHKNLHSKLTIAIMPNKVNVHNATKLHDIFNDAKQSLLLYGSYCANMQIAQNLVQDMIKTNTNKKLQLEKCQEASDKFRKFPLSDLLTLPMQRVLKYHLLLQTLLKWTPEDHVDYSGLKSAHETMKDVASFVNDVKRDQEAIISIDKIQREMTQIHLPKNKKLSDYGRRQKDGEIKVQQETDTRPKLRHVFIFDKMILLAKRKSDSYEFKDAFYLPDKYPEKTNIQPRKPEKVFPFKISIKTDNKDVDKRSIILFTKSEELRKQWMEAVEAAINNQYPPGSRSNGYHFDMTNFSGYETCHFCRKLLRGTFFQGYKCRVTEKISHKDCIPKPSSTRTSFDHTDLDIGSSVICYNNATPMNTSSDTCEDINGQKRILKDTRLSDSMLPSSEVHLLTFAKRQGSHDTLKNPSKFKLKKNAKSCDNLNKEALIIKCTKSVLAESRKIINYDSDMNYVDNEYKEQIVVNRVTNKPPFSKNIDNLDDELWYVGELDREEANYMLQELPPGTFLIRISKNQRRPGEFSLSIKDNEPKHMKIQKNNDDNTFYLEDANKFNDLRELVRYYSHACLNEYFAKLEQQDLKLTFPIKTFTQS